MCERCEKEVRTTIDIWVQGQEYYNVDDVGLQADGSLDIDAKSFDLQNEGRDYIVLCEACWALIRETLWKALCEATTCDARQITIQYGPEKLVLPAEKA
jgi:hypothetical protein